MQAEHVRLTTKYETQKETQSEMSVLMDKINHLEAELKNQQHVSRLDNIQSE